MKANLVALKECAEVLPGFSTKGALVHNPAGTHQVIIAKHITSGKPYRFIEAHKLCITPGKGIDRYLLNPGYIVFMSRGSGNYSGLLEEFPQPAIARGCRCAAPPGEPALLWKRDQLSHRQ